MTNGLQILCHYGFRKPLGVRPADTPELTRNAYQYQADNLSKLWTGVVQALVAVVLCIGGYFTYRNLKFTCQTLKATQDRLEIDREAQITNRFTQAIGHLGAELKDGKPNLEVRLVHRHDAALAPAGHAPDV